MFIQNKSRFYISLIILSSQLIACQSSDNANTDTTEAVPAQVAQPFRSVATLQEVMSAIIDPNIDYVWNSVASVSTASGIEERRPQTDQDWLVLRQHALAVAESGNLLLLEDRQIATELANTSSGGAELSPVEIKKLIVAHRQEFNHAVHGLQDASQKLLTAIAAKNVDELEKAGGEVERACEVCHSQFWYPGDTRPK